MQCSYVNTINTRLHFEKVVHIPEAGVIVLSTQLSALGISQRSLMEHVRMVAVASDFFDTQLHEQFGGVQIGEDRKKDEQIV
jgi:peroxiredoxin